MDFECLGLSRFVVAVPDHEEFDEKPYGKVSKHSMAYLKSLEFEKGAKILDLETFLNFLNEKKVGAQIELKDFNLAKIITHTVQEVELNPAELRGPIVFTSFNPLAVLKLRRVMKKQGICLLDNAQNIKGFGFGLQAIQLGSFFGKWVLRQCSKRQIWGFMTHYRYLPMKMIEYAHQLNVRFCPRVPDDKNLVLSYIDANVDGFETDNVPFIIECIEKAGYSF